MATPPLPRNCLLRWWYEKADRLSSNQIERSIANLESLRRENPDWYPEDVELVIRRLSRALPVLPGR